MSLRDVEKQAFIYHYYFYLFILFKDEADGQNAPWSFFCKVLHVNLSERAAQNQLLNGLLEGHSSNTTGLRVADSVRIN